MEQKFVSFEDAVEKLGISAERLHALREEGQLRAYRDGKSWKFRTDEIQKMVDSGVPDAPPPSDIGLVPMDELVDAAPIDTDEDDLELSLVDEDDLGKAPTPEAAASDGSDLDLELGLDDTDAVPGEKELELDGLDDTVTTGSDIALDAELPEAGPSDSILLSEETLGESVTGSPSTIIGKDKIGSDDDDLELALDDDDASDVKLAPPAAGASDVLSSGVAGSGVLDDLTGASGGTSAFKDLEELELDLAEESSPALDNSGESSEEAAGSELELDLGDSGDIELAAGDDDLILSDAGGSDLTLDSGDSGINLISPSDSGLALDDIPLEMGGSAILSSLSLEGSDPEISLIGDDAGSGDEPVAELQTDDDFQLTPLSEGSGEEGDSSSQVIALDAEIDDFSEDAAVLDDDDFAEEDDAVAFSEDFGEAPADAGVDVGYAAAPVAVATSPEAPYSVANILGLGSSALLLLIAGTMMLDMMRNIWSWDETFTLNSSLMDAILGWF
ncbi:MAG: helix-turn-helix domain-containing protein [Planctomycetota bacterium]